MGLGDYQPINDFEVLILFRKKERIEIQKIPEANSK